MKKPRPKTKPAKPRKKARCIIGRHGAGTTQRPLDPLTARFARRIATAFSGASPDQPNT